MELPAVEAEVANGGEGGTESAEAEVGWGTENADEWTDPRPSLVIL